MPGLSSRTRRAGLALPLAAGGLTLSAGPALALSPADFQFSHLRIIADAFLDAPFDVAWLLDFAHRYLGDGLWVALALYAGAVLLVIRWLGHTSDFAPHQAFVAGMTYGIGGLIGSIFLWDLMHPWREPGPLIAGVFIFAGPGLLAAMGLPGIPIGGAMWMLQELRGRRWTRYRGSGRLFPLVWRGKRGALIRTEPHETRSTGELLVLVERRRAMTTHAALCVGALLGLMYFENRVLIYGFAMGAVAAGLAFLGHLIREIAYHLGAQFIEGAKVLDPEPAHPGKAEVQTQKAYGDAKIASEAEAIDLLKRRR